MTNRWHNILGSFADWDKLRADLEDLHKKADDAGFVSWTTHAHAADLGRWFKWMNAERKNEPTRNKEQVENEN